MTEVAEQVPTDPELLFQLRSSATHLAGKPWEGAGSQNEGRDGQTFQSLIKETSMQEMGKVQNRFEGILKWQKNVINLR